MRRPARFSSADLLCYFFAVCAFPRATLVRCSFLSSLCYFRMMIDISSLSFFFEYASYAKDASFFSNNRLEQWNPLGVWAFFLISLLVVDELFS